jgi:hypothetical protein
MSGRDLGLLRERVQGAETDGHDGWARQRTMACGGCLVWKGPDLSASNRAASAVDIVCPPSFRVPAAQADSPARLGIRLGPLGLKTQPGGPLIVHGRGSDLPLSS